jgi:hypothetical protein
VLVVLGRRERKKHERLAEMQRAMQAETENRHE